MAPRACCNRASSKYRSGCLSPVAITRARSLSRLVWCGIEGGGGREVPPPSMSAKLNGRETGKAVATYSVATPTEASTTHHARIGQLDMVLIVFGFDHDR